MIFRNLTADGDWQFGQGTLNYLHDNPAIGLNVATRIRSWVGDCFFDLGAGVDWTNRLGMKNQQRLLENDLRRIILTSFGVTGINSLSLSLTQRHFNAQFNIQTIFSANYQYNVSLASSNQGVGNA